MNLIEKKTLSRIQKEKRSTIKKAALEVFSEYGLRGATLDKIAVASGLTNQTFSTIIRVKIKYILMF